MPHKFRRRLIWIPIIHAGADLGNLAESVRDVYVRKMGRAKWERHRADIDRIWRGIRARIEKMRLDYPKVRLYQDGLPTCGREAQIVRDLALAGSQNHRLLVDLMAKGARLTGTESPEFLLEEYNLAREALVAAAPREAPEAGRRRGERTRTILEKRDQYIAAQIARTLQPGETGLIFLGMLHSLVGRLPRDIEILR
jgi:hypothetical protein